MCTQMRAMAVVAVDPINTVLMRSYGGLRFGETPSTAFIAPLPRCSTSRDRGSTPHADPIRGYYRREHTDLREVGMKTKNPHDEVRLRAGQAAAELGVGVQTLHYYEREELIPAPPRSTAGYRLYPPDLMERLRFIRQIGRASCRRRVEKPSPRACRIKTLRRTRG